MKKVFCLVGLQGAGKTEFSSFFENKISVTDIIKKFLEDKKQKPNEFLTKQTYYMNLRDKEELLTKRIIDEITNSKHNEIILDDIKTKKQVIELKKYFDIKIIGIYSNDKNRFDRLKGKFKTESILTWEKYIFDIYVLQNQADYRIFNNNGLKDLEVKQKEFIENKP